MDSYIYRIGSRSSVLGKPPCFYLNTELRAKHCTFASVYSVTLETARAIQEAAQTCQGFKGVVWSQRLWTDFDTYEAGQKALERLKEYDIVAYDTGGRGMHIGIARDAKPSHTLPQQDKAWVSTNLNGADLSLYWHLHLIRLPGTIHEKTGKPKKLILRHEGRSLQLPPIEETVHTEAKESNLGGSSKVGSIFSSWEVMNLLQPTGERSQLVKLAAAIQRTGASKYEALSIVLEVNAGFSKPRESGEVERIVKWAYNDIE